MSHKELYYTYTGGGSKTPVDYNRKRHPIGSKTLSASSSKRSANYNRIVPASAINYKNNIKIPYKNELLRQITGGSKTFFDLVKKRPEKQNMPDTDNLDPANDFELLEKDNVMVPEEKVEIIKKPEVLLSPKEQVKSSNKAEGFTAEQKDLIDKILADDSGNAGRSEKNPKLTVKTIKTISDISKKEAVPYSQVKTIKDLEDNIVSLTIEIEKLKNNQKYIVRALNRLLKSGSKK